MNPPTHDLPTHASIVVIGGGIIGCSTAYHLAKDHAADVVLLEQGSLSNGSTWHAAGLVGQLRSSASITQVLKYSVDLYTRLELETGLATGWKQNGGLRLACNKERWTEICRQATTAHSFGLEMNLLTPAEAKSLWPLMDISDLVGAAFLPTDGQGSPSDITQSLARGAKNNGARLIENIRVTDVLSVNDCVSGVQTDRGIIQCEKIVNCAGIWAAQIGKLAGVNIPLQAVQHQYLITDVIQGVTADLATLRDPDRLIYFKEEVGGLTMGGYEFNPISWADKGIPEKFEFQLLENNWDHFQPLMEQAIERVPALESAGVKQLINGPESFTPDGNYIMGEAPELKHFFVGAGFNAFGIAAAGGAGWTLAEWVVSGEQPMDLWSVDIRRFSQLHSDKKWVRERTLEAYGKHYTVAFPHEEYTSGRPRIVSPLYKRLLKRGACMGSKLGWERPNWFANKGGEAQDKYSMGRQNWFDAVGEEHRACREQVALFDQSSFAKYELRGTDAESALSWIAANDVRKAPGKVVYTQILNSRGGIECDLTAARLAPDLYYIVTGTAFRTHDAAWIREHLPAGGDVTLHDVTETYGTLSIFGPNARNVLQTLCPEDVSHTAFRFGTVKQLTLVGQKVRALRITYVGELGWELHLPVSVLGEVFDAIMQAGEAYSIKLAGYRAIESLRLEKAYRAWGSDITANDSPIEAGLAWAVKMNGQQDFIGRQASLAIAAKPLKKKLVGFTVDNPECVLLGRETIIRDGENVGYLTSAGYGYTLGQSIAYGYVKNPAGVDKQFLGSGHYELEVAGDCFPCQLQTAIPLDPGMKKIKV